jgi:hypothetical protein
VNCGFCGRPFHLGPTSLAPSRNAVLVTDRLWRDAMDGSQLFEHYLLGQPCGWLPPRLIWSFASIPIRRQSEAQIDFGLILPETSDPAFGRLHGSPATTCRTANPFKRLALIAAVHRFNKDPVGWLQAFSNAATAAGKAAIANLLGTLPNAIAERMRGGGRAPSPNSGYACQAVETHQTSIRLAANLRQVREFCLKLTHAAPHNAVGSHD